MEDTKPRDEELAKQDSVSLGGGIQLNGFKGIEAAKMIVLKKMIGNYVKQIQEKREDYEKISITFEGDKNNVNIRLELSAGGNNIKAEESQNNLFTTTDNAFKKLLEQL